MVSIYVNGEDKTRQISDWKIGYRAGQGELMLTCHFPSGKSYSRPLRDCEIVPTETVQGQLLAKKGGAVFSAVDKATVYGEKYVVVQYPGNPKTYVHLAADVILVPATAIKDAVVFRYFVSVAQARIERAVSQDKKNIAENVLRQLEKVAPHLDTALHAYCTGQNQRREWTGNLIYPFGVNASQLKAVERAFTSQVSLIEGPPGTGKTQTILNIIANILLAGKTVAILSNNNPAVENVYEKLDKGGLGHLIARLGSTENRENFFAVLPEAVAPTPVLVPKMQHLQDILMRLKQYLHDQNEAARLQAEIDELSVEQRYLLQWQRDNETLAPVPLEQYKLSPRKAADLMAYLSYMAENRIRLRDRVELLLNFSILRMKSFGDWEKRKTMIHALQLHFYEKALLDKSAKLAVCRKRLERGDFKRLLDKLTADSMTYLKHHLHQRAPDGATFDAKNYSQKFDAFVKRYPIIGSSTHSIVNSIAAGAILDYVILDEASLQDIVPGVLALGCARNLVIVGDRKQLPHIPAHLGVAPPAEFYDCDRYSLLDSCLGIFGDAIPVTLLREHYRCHPRAIALYLSLP
ncbi:MAG: AAA family ATPase [Pseudomonadales bacterium]|jgi:RecA/RadA recombinase|nr:AAA family ATPase [Pseudomonadales bacterium]